MDLCILGGDARFAIIAELACEQGHRVICCGLDRYPHRFGLQTDSVEMAVSSAGVVILPLPLTKDGSSLFAPLSSFDIKISDIIKTLRRDQLVLGGMVSNEIADSILKTGASVEDYFCREELTVINAVSTAEGTLQTVMQETDFTVFGSRVLVVGYGHVGKAVAAKFSALGARVTVSARKARDIALITSNSMRGIPTADIKKYIRGFDVVINTVPAPVITSAVIEGCPENILIVELASHPGGIDLDAAAHRGVQVITAPSLPGRVAPRSAAAAIFGTLTSILEENNLE